MKRILSATATPVLVKVKTTVPRSDGAGRRKIREIEEENYMNVRGNFRATGVVNGRC